MRSWDEGTEAARVTGRVTLPSAGCGGHLRTTWRSCLSGWEVPVPGLAMLKWGADKPMERGVERRIAGKARRGLCSLARGSLRGTETG